MPQWKDGKTVADSDTIDECRAYIETNLTAPFAMSQTCIPCMKMSRPEAWQMPSRARCRPCIIHISSFREHWSDPNQEGYASCILTTAQPDAQHVYQPETVGIGVNLIAPGRIRVAQESKEGDKMGKDW